MRHPLYILAICLLLSTTAARAEVSESFPTIVEGHVFNKWTGVPLSNARIQVFSSNEHGMQNNFNVRTDDNGFYSVVLDAEFSLRVIVAICGSKRKGTTFSKLSLPDPSVDFARRDAYLDVPRRRGFSLCIDLLVPL